MGTWAVGLLWAYRQSLHPMVPTLLSLFTIEILVYYPHRCGVVWAGGYLLLANGLMGVLPGVHLHPFWPWATMAFWIVAEGLVWGALLILGRVSLWGPSLTALTPRERGVLTLSEAGLTMSEIATQLHIELSTVKSHLTHIHRTLGTPPHGH